MGRLDLFDLSDDDVVRHVVYAVVGIGAVCDGGMVSIGVVGVVVLEDGEYVVDEDVARRTTESSIAWIG